MDSAWTTIDAGEYLQQSSSFKDNPKVIETFRGFQLGEVVSISGSYREIIKYITDALGLDSDEHDSFRKLCNSYVKWSYRPKSKVPNDAWQTMKLLDVVPPDRREALQCDFINLTVKKYAKTFVDDYDFIQYLNTSSQSLKSKIAACIIYLEYSQRIPDYEEDLWMYIPRDETVTFIIQGFSDELFPRIVQDDQSFQDFFEFCCRYESWELKDLLDKYLRGDNERFSLSKEDWPDIKRYHYPFWLENREEHVVYWPSITEMRTALRGVCISMQNGIIVLKYPKWLYSITSINNRGMCKMLFAFLNSKVTYALNVGIIGNDIKIPEDIDLRLSPQKLFVSTDTGFVHADVLVFESPQNMMSREHTNRVCRMIHEHIRLMQLPWDNDDSFMILCHHKSFENQRVNLLFNSDEITRTWAEKMAKGLSRCLAYGGSKAFKICDDKVSVQCIDDKIRFFFFSWPKRKSNTLASRAKDHIKRILMFHVSHSVECRELHKYYRV